MERGGTYYKQMFNVSDEELKSYQKIVSEVRDQLEEVFESYYHYTETSPLFSDQYTEEVNAGVKINEEALWINLVDFPLGDIHVETLRAFGKTFASMGVSFDAYIGAIVAFHSFVTERVTKKELVSLEWLLTFKKLAGISYCIVASAYHEMTSTKLREQNEALKELSTPIAEIWDGILLLPLVGFIDSRRANSIMASILSKISETQSKIFILDISGIAIVDTAVANYLIKMTKACKLMGCYSIISGISASVAQTIIELGIDVEDLETTGSMRDALKNALAYAKVNF